MAQQSSSVIAAGTSVAVCLPFFIADSMDKFEFRRDRYESFRQYANPLLNLSVVARLPEFRHYCKERQLPPFHFLLYCLYMAKP